MSSSRCPVCSWLLFSEGNVLAEFEEGDSTLRILLHAMTMLIKLMCALKVTFSMKVSLTEIKEDDSEDTPCDKGKKTRF